jgi:protein involved in polysaccharide export with SLBB domain
MSLLGLDQSTQLNLPKLQGTEMLISSVDENEYRIDAGDMFIIKIDVKGPASKVFNSVVSADGYIVTPNAPAIYVKDLTLKNAKVHMNKILKMNFPRARIESHLFQIHPVRVTVLGALPRPGKITVSSSDRLFDAVTGMLEPMIADTTLEFEWKSVSFRNVEVRRDLEIINYDLLRFRMTGDRHQNPYLMDEDIIYINYRDSLEHTISVFGAVGRTVNMEYRSGDDLKLAINFASGLLPTADSSRIELVRLNANNDTFTTKYVTLPADQEYALQPNDRIYVRKKEDHYKSSDVLLRGEVKYPGVYAIESGRTTLSQLINRAGGFTPHASMQLARVERFSEFIEKESELIRLRDRRQLELNPEEISFYRLRSRENRIIVSADFEKIFTEKDEDQDVLLFDRDIINIPKRTMTVFVSGGVQNPGKILYNEDYIDAAGGYSDLAIESWVSIIDARTGKWTDADDDSIIGEGDIIFIAEKDRLDWYEVFMDGLGIVSQAATIVLIVISLGK